MTKKPVHDLKKPASHPRWAMNFNAFLRAEKYSGIKGDQLLEIHLTIHDTWKRMCKNSMIP